MLLAAGPPSRPTPNTSLAAAAATARTAAEQAQRELADALREDADRVDRFGTLARTADAAARLADTDRDLTATRTAAGHRPGPHHRVHGRARLPRSARRPVHR